MRHDPPRQTSDGAQLFQAISNEGETDKPLIGMMKLPAVSLFHVFLANTARGILIGTARRLKIPSGLPLKP